MTAYSRIGPTRGTQQLGWVVAPTLAAPTHPSLPPTPAGCGSALPHRPCIDHKMQQAGLVFSSPLCQAGVRALRSNFQPPKSPKLPPKSRQKVKNYPVCIRAPPLLIMYTITRSLFARLLCLSSGHPRSSTVGDTQ